MKIAVIEKQQSGTNYKSMLFDNKYDPDVFALCSDLKVQKVLKRDVDIDIDTDQYSWVVLVGSEATRHYTKLTKVMDYAGVLVEDKFIPTINPSMLNFKPEAKSTWDNAKANIIDYIEGVKKKAVIGDKFVGIQDEEATIEYIQRCIDSPVDYFGIDSETSGLYPRNGHILGISLCYEKDCGAYIDANAITWEAEQKLQELFLKKRAVFHNAKFDVPMFEYHFNMKIPRFEDTMLLHYTMNENPGTHGLKQLAMKYTDYGDYEKDLYTWIEGYRKRNGVLTEDFSWEVIPFDVMQNYAALDACVTFHLFEMFMEILNKGNSRLLKLYNEILIPACRFLMDVQDNGVPFCRERLIAGQSLMDEEIRAAVEELYSQEDVQRFNQKEQKQFNPNSVLQLRKLLFDYIGLEPTGIETDKGENSTNSEALEILSAQHSIPKLILDVRKKTKIKNTYLDKIIPQLDRDGHLRTNFNLHGTTSGRLSSSGKLNMQQIPRDDPIVKGCIRAKEGHKIVAMDLTTAEVYVAAVLADDKELQDVFRSGGNFHSTIAHKVFKLPCDIDKVAEYYPDMRQAAKAVTFGIMYGAGPKKIAEQVTKDGGSMTSGEAKQIISEYFGSFKNLKKWIDSCHEEIIKNSGIYSYFGRKRRLKDVKSDNEGVKSHAIRSGLNFMVQSTASDINLIGGIEAHGIIKDRGLKSKIFALVHDSVLAEVPIEEVDEYCEILKTCIQKDRGIFIPGAPIGCDFEVGDDYSMGKFDAKYGSLFTV